MKHKGIFQVTKHLKNSHYKMKRNLIWPIKFEFFLHWVQILRHRMCLFSVCLKLQVRTQTTCYTYATAQVVIQFIFSIPDFERFWIEFLWLTIFTLELMSLFIWGHKIYFRTLTLIFGEIVICNGRPLQFA